MTILDILAGLKSGDIQIDYKGHRVNPIIDRIEGYCEFLQETIRDNQDEIIKEYFQNKFNRDYRIGDNIDIQAEIYCFDCGLQNSYLVLESNKLISLNYVENGNGKHYYTGTCEGVELRNKGHIRNDITIEYGKMLISNYFKVSTSLDEEINQYSREYRLNSILGRKNLSHHYAKHGVGYGQMGNMSFNVFLRNDGEEVIFTDTYYYDQENDIEIEPTYEGFKHVGKVDCGVWRWEVSGLKNLRQLNEKYNIDTPIEDERELLQLEVIPGKWKIEHYYDLMNGDEIVQNNHVYSRLKLIK